ncbi:hypothetical protein [Geothrix sp. 21YS21S-4]|uniref:hypothetical protein n=1 Tax=Geothrix sp. 21YS21S-4 TaxID=3068889 RepID=UPI0027BA3E39|nr:hypothetical protein [Geothrix sp. 21YS21S-4]
MHLKLIAAIVFAASGVEMNAQQALLLDSWSAIAYKNFKISSIELKVSNDEKTFLYDGQTYPYSGQAYWAMVENNRKKFNVLDHIRVEKGKLFFDGVVMDVGGPVEQIYQALSWGDSIACLGYIPHTPKAWWEPKKAHAIFVFSPTEKQGSYLGLTLAGKVNYQLTLIDPVEKGE